MNLTQVPISMIDTVAGDAGKVLTSDGTSWSAASKLTSGTAVTLTNQTFVDFTGIPSTAKRVTFMFRGISTGGTASAMILRVGSGSIVTTGYLSQCWANSSSGAYSDGLMFIYTANNALTWSGVYVLDLITDNTWVAAGCAAVTSAGSSLGLSYAGETPNLAGPLDRIRLTTQSGAATFDGGTVNITWE